MATKSSTTSTAVGFMIVGKTRVGKSSIINSVAGEKIAKEGKELDTGANFIKSYIFDHSEQKIKFWDTPGSFDTCSNPEKYIEEIREKYAECDVILYCSNMIDKRITEQDKRRAYTFTQYLGVTFWQRTVFVFTFANEVVDLESLSERVTERFFNEKFDILKRKYCEMIRDIGISSDVVSNIPFVAAGASNPSRPKKIAIPLGKNTNYA